MVDRDDGEWGATLQTLHWDSRSVKCGGHGVDRDGVVRGGCVLSRKISAVKVVRETRG